MVGGASALPTIAYADAGPVSFKDKSGYNATLNVQVSVNPPASNTEWAKWPIDSAANAASVGAAAFSMIKPGTDLTSASDLYYQPWDLLLYPALDDGGYDLSFPGPRASDFSWSGYPLSSVITDPPLFAPWCKLGLVNDEYDMDVAVDKMAYIGSTNTDVAEAILNPTNGRINLANYLYDIEPKSPGTATLYFSFAPKKIDGTYCSLSNTEGQSADFNFTKKVYAINVTVGGDSQAQDSWDDLPSGFIDFCDQTTRSDFAFMEICDEEGNPFEGYQRCVSNSAFNEIRIDSLIDFNQPCFKISHWLSGAFPTAESNYKGAIEGDDMQGAIEEIMASFFERTILSQIRLYDNGSVRDASYLVDPSNVVAKGATYPSSDDGVIKMKERLGTMNTNAADLVGKVQPSTGGSMTASTYMFVSSGVVCIDTALQPDHEYVLYFSMLPGHYWPYSSDAMMFGFDGCSVIKKDVIFRFRTKPQATSLQLDAEQVYIGTVQSGKDPETVTVNASLLAGDKPASGTVKWTMNRQDVADMDVSDDGLSATFTAKASAEASVLVTASAYDGEGKAIPGATASCVVTAAYPFDKITFQDSTYFLAAVDGRMISFGMQAYRPTYTVNGQPVSFGLQGKKPSGVKWKSSDESVATVDTYGDVRPVGNGDATITVTAVAPYDGTNYASASCVVKVREMAASITLDKDSVILPVPTTAGAASVQLTAALLTASGQPVSSDINHVNWTSSNASVVTVDENGKVTAVGQGTAAITASSDTDKAVSNNGVSKSCTVQVFPFANSVTLDKESLTLDAPGFLGTGTSATLVPTIGFPTGQSNYMNKVKITWESSNEKVATVVDGVVTAVAAGNATIKAIATYPEDGSVYATCTVAVTTPDPALEFDLSSIEVAVGATGTLAASWVNGTEELETAGLAWSSDNTSVVTVDNTGAIEAVGAGSATITVSSIADPSIKATIGVLVRVVPATLQISSTSLSLETKKTVSETTTAELTAQALDASGNPVNEGSLVWESSAPAVASVVGEGNQAVVTAVSGGTATVTVKLQAPAGTTMEWPNLSASCQVAVTDITPAIIQMSHTSLIMEPPEDGSYAVHPLTVSVTNKDGVKLDDPIALESTDPSVVSVDADGTLTAKKVGSATIKATCYDAQPGVCTVAVHAFPSGINLVAATDDQQDLLMAISEGRPYEVQVQDGFALPALEVIPADASYTRIEWHTSDPTVLEVPKAGGHVIAKTVNEEGVKVIATVVMDADKIVTNGSASSPASTPSLMALLTGAEQAYATEGDWEAPSSSFDVVVHEREEEPVDPTATGDGSGGNATPVSSVAGPATRTSLAQTGDRNNSLALMFTAAAAVAGAGAYVMYKMSERDKAQIKEGAKEVGDFIDDAINKLGHGVVKAKAAFLESSGLADAHQATPDVHDVPEETSESK